MRSIGSVCEADKSPLVLELPKVEWEIVRGRAKRKTRPVRGKAFLIGADADCDLVLGDRQFGEIHSYLLVSPTRVSIRHLGFGPPLLVGGQQVAWASLRDADRVEAGPYEFVVRITWPARRGAPLNQDEDRPRFVRQGDAQYVMDRLLRDIHGSTWPRHQLSLYAPNESTSA